MKGGGRAGDQLGSYFNNPCVTVWVQQNRLGSVQYSMGLENGFNSVLYELDVEYEKKAKV